MNEPQSSLPTLDGKYKLVRQLGEGGMGAVYEARHSGTGRRCAVKVIVGEALGKSPEIVARFQREAMASGAIESQYIAQVLDTGVDPASGSPYLVMELLVGEDVYHAIQRLGPVPADVAMRIAAQACLGLQKAHAAGTVHRDIKPANLFLASRDHGEIVTKVLDFGIAKVKTEPQQSLANGGGALTRTGAMLGSPLYMSPEQALGKKSIDHRTDLWSLGIVLYEMLTGLTPCADATTIGQLIMQICSQPPRNVQDAAPWVKPEVAAVVHKALAMDPAARFQSAQEMFGALEYLLPGGFALSEKMFVKVSQRTRSIPAPPFGVPSEAMRPPAPSVDALPMPSADARRAVVSTTAGFGHSWQPPAMRKPSRAQALMLAGGVASMAAMLVGAWLWINAAPTPAAESDPSPADSTAAAAPSPPAAEPPPSPVAPSPVAPSPVAPTPVSFPPMNVAPTPSQHHPPPPLLKAAPPSAAAQPSAPRPTPSPAAPAPAAPAPTKPSCDPPYTLDRAGNKHFKPECF